MRCSSVLNRHDIFQKAACQHDTENTKCIYTVLDIHFSFYAINASILFLVTCLLAILTINKSWSITVSRCLTFVMLVCNGWKGTIWYSLTITISNKTAAHLLTILKTISKPDAQHIHIVKFLLHTIHFCLSICNISFFPYHLLTRYTHK